MKLQILALFTGIICTVYSFVLFDLNGKYGMNPLAFIWCILPFLLSCLVVPLVGDDDDDKKDKEDRDSDETTK